MEIKKYKLKRWVIIALNIILCLFAAISAILIAVECDQLNMLILTKILGIVFMYLTITIYDFIEVNK